MTGTTRKAQYADKDTRIVVVPGTADQWRSQRRGPGNGTREYDPWINESRPLAYALAKAAAGIKS
jgi:hypothetical protein